MNESAVENLIRQAVEEICTCAENSIKQNMNFSDIVSDAKQTLNNVACSLLEWIFSAVEQSFDSARDKHQIVVRNRNKERNLLTEFGTVRLRHTLYFDKKQERYFFAADELLQIEKYSRIAVYYTHIRAHQTSQSSV